MILVLGGTGDGRKLVRSLVKAGEKVGVIPFSCYGKELAREDGAYVVEEINDQWLQDKKIQAVIDARHPYSFNTELGGISKSIVYNCEEAGISFYRIGREETIVNSEENIYRVLSMEQAAGVAATLGKNIFLTTGSSQLEPFLAVQKEYNVRLVVRVLPEHSVIKKCQDLGIKPKDIVAMQGPFSKQINKALFKMYRASVIVTKDSGKAGGTDTKLAAARTLNLPVVIVKREVSDVTFNWEEVYKILTCKRLRKVRSK